LDRILSKHDGDKTFQYGKLFYKNQYNKEGKLNFIGVRAY